LENGIDGTITVFVDKLDESVRRWKVWAETAVDWHERRKQGRGRERELWWGNDGEYEVEKGQKMMKWNLTKECGDMVGEGERLAEFGMIGKCLAIGSIVNNKGMAWKSVGMSRFESRNWWWECGWRELKEGMAGTSPWVLNQRQAFLGTQIIELNYYYKIAVNVIICEWDFTFHFEWIYGHCLL
jgi:hypothetical protein